MEENKNMISAESEQYKVIKNAVDELKGANEEELKITVEKWFEKTRTEGMKIGAYYMSAGIYGIIQKHTKKGGKVSLRDYERCVAEILKVIAVQLKTQQTNSEDENDRATEDVSDTNS